MQIVCDTGPILHLIEINALDLLDVAGGVCIPPVVERELLSLIPDWPNRKPEWITIVDLDEEHLADVSIWQTSGLLHAGEAESIALARQVHSIWYLTDDTASRVFGISQGLEVHGTLGVVLWAAANRHIDRPHAETLLRRLRESTLWISVKVFAEAWSALDRLY